MSTTHVSRVADALSGNKVKQAEARTTDHIKLAEDLDFIADNLFGMSDDRTYQQKVAEATTGTLATAVGVPGRQPEPSVTPMKEQPPVKPKLVSDSVTGAAGSLVVDLKRDDGIVNPEKALSAGTSKIAAMLEDKAAKAKPATTVETPEQSRGPLDISAIPTPAGPAGKQTAPVMPEADGDTTTNPPITHTKEESTEPGPPTNAPKEVVEKAASAEDPLVAMFDMVGVKTAATDDKMPCGADAPGEGGKGVRPALMGETVGRIRAARLAELEEEKKKEKGKTASDSGVVPVDTAQTPGPASVAKAVASASPESIAKVTQADDEKVNLDKKVLKELVSNPETHASDTQSASKVAEVLAAKEAGVTTIDVDGIDADVAAIRNKMGM